MLIQAWDWIFDKDPQPLRTLVEQPEVGDGQRGLGIAQGKSRSEQTVRHASAAYEQPGQGMKVGVTCRLDCLGYCQARLFRPLSFYFASSN